MKTLTEMMANSKILSLLPVRARDELTRIATKQHYMKGKVLFHQGDLWPFVILITEGKLRSVIQAPDGRSFVTGIWETGMEFWGHTLFDGDGMPSRAEALEDVTGYLWQGEDIYQQVVRYPNVVRGLLRRQTQLIRRRRDIIYNLAFSPVTSRVARLVIELFEKTAMDTVQRELTLEEMAVRIATSPEVVCRTLHQFHSNGLVEIKRASITLKDRQGLVNLIGVE